MDATAVTLYGMRLAAISTFGAALLGVLAVLVSTFIAEPIRIRAQNKIKLENLRIALYKELIGNYFTFYSDCCLDWEKALHARENFQDWEVFGFRSECYTNALSNQTDLFYQLQEAMAFNGAYAQLKGVRAFPSKEDKGASEEQRKPTYESFRLKGAFFLTFVTQHFLLKDFDRKVLEKIVYVPEYNLVIKGRDNYLIPFYAETESEAHHQQEMLRHEKEPTD